MPAREAAALLALAASIGAASWWASTHAPRVPHGEVIEVVGSVRRPGFHVLPGATVAGALRAAWAAGGDDRPLYTGHRVTVRGGLSLVSAVGDPLLVGLRIDPNTADASALSAIPGIGRVAAEAIVAERACCGGYRSVDALVRAPGVGPATVEEARGLLEVRAPPPPAPPLHLNRATRAELERLPGIGPALAERIVAYRALHGDFADVASLSRVKGIGPVTVARLQGRVVAGAP